MYSSIVPICDYCTALLYVV